MIKGQAGTPPSAGALLSEALPSLLLPVLKWD